MAVSPQAFCVPIVIIDLEKNVRRSEILRYVHIGRIQVVGYIRSCGTGFSPQQMLRHSPYNVYADEAEEDEEGEVR